MIDQHSQQLFVILFYLLERVRRLRGLLMLGVVVRAAGSADPAEPSAGSSDRPTSPTRPAALCSARIILIRASALCVKMREQASTFGKIVLGGREHHASFSTDGER